MLKMKIAAIGISLMSLASVSGASALSLPNALAYPSGSGVGTNTDLNNLTYPYYGRFTADPAFDCDPSELVFMPGSVWQVCGN